MNTLAAAAVGLLAGLGALLMVAGARGNQVLPRPKSPTSDRPDRDLALAASSLVAALVLWALTGWIVAAVAGGAAVWGTRHLFSRRAESQRAVARTEAIAVWTEQIRDNMAAAAGLEQALLTSAAHAPESIADEVTRFVSRIDRGVHLLDALADLGDELDHPAADLVVVALANAVRLEARDLGPLLSRLALFIRADVRMRLRIEVSRARIRTSARIVVVTTFFTAAFLFVFSPNLLDAYDSVAGQLWLLVVIGVFVAAGALMRSLASDEYPGRFSARRQAFGPVR